MSTRRMFHGTLTLALAAALVAALAAPARAADESTPAMPADHPPMSPPAPRVSPATVLARVGQITVTAGDADDAIAGYGARERFEFAARDALRDLVEGLIDRKLMAQAARAAGMDDPGSPLSERALAETWLERELARIPPPNEAAIVAYYRENPAEFRVPRRVRVTRGVARTTAAAASLRDELSRGTSVEELRRTEIAGAGSIETLWLQDAAKKPALVAAALELKKGEVSAPLPVETGYAVLRAEELAPAAARPLEDVRAGIAARLESAAREQAMTDIRARLRRNVQIVIDDAALTSYSPPPPGG